MTRPSRVVLQPLTLQRQNQSATEGHSHANADAMKHQQAAASLVSQPTPAWKSPKASSGPQWSARAVGPAFSPSLTGLSTVLVSPRKGPPPFPTELWEAVARACCDELGAPDVQTLRSLSSVCSATRCPAQRALVNHLELESPSSIEKLIRTLLRTPRMGRAARSLTIKLRKPVAGVSNDTCFKTEAAGSRGQEIALLGLLPLIPRIRHVRIECQYDCPESVVQLATCTLPEVSSVDICSAYGYNRLVYMTDASLCRVITGWPKLNALNLSMPWVLHSPRGMRWALSQSHVRTPTLSSFDISGYRGSPAALKGLLALCQGSIKRFVFDCPIDEEPWYDLDKIFKELDLHLHHLSLWSWTMAMPVEDILSISNTKELKHLTINSSCLDDELAAKMPKSLESLTLCAHPEFAYLDIDDLVRLAAQGLPKSLQHIAIYNPSPEKEDISLLQSALAQHKIAVSYQDDSPKYEERHLFA